MANNHKDESFKPRAIAVALFIENYVDGVKKRFNILCLDTMKTSAVYETEIYGILKAGTMDIDNLTIDNNKVVGSNGSIDRLPRLRNGKLITKPSLTIINEIKDFGYFVSDWNGRAINMDYEQAVDYAINKGISNGKVVTTANKRYISSINGTYHLNEKDGKVLNRIGELNMKLQLLEAPYYINYDYGVEITDNNIKTITVIGANRLGKRTFTFCPNLEEIKIAEKDIVLEPGALSQAYNVSRIVLPEGISQIPENAFEDDRKLRLINIPDSVTKIGAGAFIRCKELRSIVIPDGVKTIGKGAFEYCYKLEYIKLPNKISKLADKLFLSCTSLKSIELPESITSIGSQTFDGCESLEEIRIPKNVVSISKSAFSYCHKLRTMHVPKKLNTDNLKSLWNTSIYKY